MSKHFDQIAPAAEELLGERVLAAAFAKPRGSTTVAAGGLAGSLIGGHYVRGQHEGASAAGLVLANPMAVAITPTRLATIDVSVSLGGQIKSVNHLLSAVALDDIDGIDVKRFGLAGVMTIELGGSSFKLEGKVPDLRALADAIG